MSYTDLLQITQFTWSTQFKCQKQFYFKQLSSAEVRSLNAKNGYISNNSVGTQIICILPIHWTQPVVTNPYQGEPINDVNIGILCIPQSSSINGTSP